MQTEFNAFVLVKKKALRLSKIDLGVDLRFASLADPQGRLEQEDAMRGVKLLSSNFGVAFLWKGDL